MAYDFLGTANNHQIARLTTFLQAQGVDVPGRILHLSAEQQRIGTLVFTYDQGGNPIGYNANPATSYIGKLVMAYEVLGGDPLFDLQVRSMSQPVFVVAGTQTQPGQRLSSGDVMGQPGLMDGLSASIVQQMKGWSQDVVQYKRENIERKVRRAVDYSDQLGAEIKILTVVLVDAQTTGSLANYTTQISTLLADPTYRAIYNDINNDLHGKFTHAPFSAYDPGPNRTIDPNFVRADGGPVIPGQQTSPIGAGNPSGGT